MHLAIFDLIGALDPSTDGVVADFHFGEPAVELGSDEEVFVAGVLQVGLDSSDGTEDPFLNL